MNALLDRDDVPEQIDARELIDAIKLRRWWIVGSVAAFTAISITALFLITPIYRVTTVLAPAAADRGDSVLGLTGGALGGLASAAGVDLSPRDVGTEEAIAVLKSRQFTEDFIISRNLMAKLYPDRWSLGIGGWPDQHRPPTLARAYKYFDGKICLVTEDRQTGLITVQIDWTDPHEAADWANELVRVLNAEMRNRAMEKADASLQFLTLELQKKLPVEARDAISRLIEVQMKQRMLAEVTPDYSFRVVDRAIGSDGETPVWPRMMLFLAGGPLIGLAVGISLVLLMGGSPMEKE